MDTVIGYQFCYTHLTVAEGNHVH